MMNKKLSIVLVIGLISFGVLFLSGLSLANADALQQAAYQTPTPNEDGQILYTVLEGDTCLRISLLTLLSIDELIELNDLSDDCLIVPGQELILGFATQATETPDTPEPEPTPGPPTPTPFEGNAEVCVVLYEDLDGNQMRSQNEFYLGGGVVSINNRAGTFSETKETSGGDPAIVDPVCFEEVPEGDYNLSMAIPEGYNPTTSMNYALAVSAGDTIVIDFGAQPGSQLLNADTTVAGRGRSPTLLVIGLLLLAGGAGFAFFFIRSSLNA